MDNDCGAQPGVLPPLEDECVKYVALSAAHDVRHILHPDEVRDAAAVAAIRFMHFCPAARMHFHVQKTDEIARVGCDKVVF
jgi:hypothetical protein